MSTHNLTTAEVAELVARRNAAEENAERLLDRAALQNRDLLASEARQFDRLIAEKRSLDATLDTVPRQTIAAARDRAIVESRTALGLPADFGSTVAAPVTTGDLFALIRSNGQGFVDLPVGDLLAGKRTAPNGAMESRDLLTSTTGAPVPVQTAATVYEYLVSESGVLRSNVDILSTPNGDTYRLPKFSAYSTGTAVAEGSAIPESDPTLATIEFGAYKYGAKIEFTRELEFDANVPLTTYLGRNLGVAISQAIAPKLISGSGTAEPQGIIAAAGGTVTGGTGQAGVPTVAEIIDLVYTVEAPYQANASFVMHPTTLSKIAKIVDTTGRSILLPSLSADTPATILGRPVYTDPFMPTTGTTKVSMFFGDLSRYASVRMAGAMRFEVSYEEKFSNDLVVCKALQRIDCRIVDSRAGAIYKGAAS